MARTTATDSSNTAATPAPAVPAPASADPADVVFSPVQAGQKPADAATSHAGVDAVPPATITIDEKPSAGVQADTELTVDDKGEITIYPLRSYLDGKEVRRAGGGGYKSPKHDAVSLIAAGLATDNKPKA